MTFSLTRTLAASLLTLVFLSAAPPGLFAQNNSLSVTVTPPLIQLSIGPGEGWASSLKVVNSNAYDVEYYAEVVNFESDGEGGASKFTPVLDSNSEHTLAGWITVSPEPVLVPAGQSADIPFSVAVPENASPGGHYAAILVGTRSGRQQSNGPSVAISSFVTSLIFVRVQGEVIEQGRIREFRTAKTLYETPNADFLLRFENTGNTHLRPQGSVTIYNMWGKERGQLAINQTRNLGNVLPQSTRRFAFSWEGERSVFDIGRYSAVVTLAYGEDDKKNVSATTYFWVVPTVPVAATLGSVLVFLFLMTWFIRRYIRRALTLERQRFGVHPNTPAPEPSSIGALMEPLKEGAIDLRSLVNKRNSERAVLTEPGLTKEPVRTYQPLTLSQFVRKYRIFFFFIAVLLVGSIGLWFYLENAMQSERRFVITDVTVHEEQPEEIPSSE
jgi:hypothetical protein